MAWLITGIDHGSGQILGSLAAPGPMIGNNSVEGAVFLRFRDDQLELGVRVRRESIHTDHHWHRELHRVLDLQSFVLTTIGLKGGGNEPVCGGWSRSLAQPVAGSR